MGTRNDPLSSPSISPGGEGRGSNPQEGGGGPNPGGKALGSEQEACFGSLACAAPCVMVGDADPQCLRPHWRLRSVGFVTQPLRGPPEHAGTVDVLRRSFIHSANIYGAPGLCPALPCSAPGGRGPHLRRACRAPVAATEEAAN